MEYTHGIILNENQRGETSGYVAYPGLQICVGLTVVASTGEKAGAHLTPPWENDYTEYHAGLRFCWDFYEKHSGHARFILSWNERNTVSRHEEPLESAGTPLATECLWLLRNILATRPVGDCHKGLPTATGPVHQIRADGQPAEYASELEE